MTDSGAFIALFVLWLVVLALCVLVVATLRHLAFLYERLEPFLRLSTNAYLLHLNEPVPAAIFSQPGAGDRQLADFPERRLFVLVVQTSCSACHGILRLAGSALNDAQAAGWRVVVVVAGGDERTAMRLQLEFHLDTVTFVADRNGAAARAWGITSTPAGLVAEGGLVRHILPTVAVDQVKRTLGREDDGAVPVNVTLSGLPLLNAKQPTGGER
jgi:hypothetical protein